MFENWRAPFIQRMWYDVTLSLSLFLCALIYNGIIALMLFQDGAWFYGHLEDLGKNTKHLDLDLDLDLDVNYT